MPLLEEIRDWSRASPSQLRMQARCERKWYLRYVAGWEIPFTAATALGTKIHALLENYFNTGRLELTQDQREEMGNETPEELALVVAGLVHYPDRKAPLHVEKEILVNSVVPILGFADLVHLHPTSPTVFDHKTTSAWRYAKTAEELMTDPQAIIYTKAVMDEVGADHALFKHVYYLTDMDQKSHRTKTTGIVMTRKQNDAEFEKIEGQLHRMKELSQTKDPSEAKPNYEACFDYGGCPFRYYCNKHKEGGAMGLFKDLKNQKDVSKDDTKTSKKKPKQESVASAPEPDAPAPQAELPAMGAVNPPETATQSVANAPKGKRQTKSKAATAGSVLTPIQTAAIACLPTASGLVPDGSDEQIVRRAVLLAKEVLRQTAE